jgi:hypothetical protein
VLDTSEEVVDGIRGGEALSEAELGGGEVVGRVELSGKSTMDEMFEYSNDNAGHGDGAVGACQ